MFCSPISAVMVLKKQVPDKNMPLQRWHGGFFVLVIVSLLLVLLFHFPHQSIDALFGGKAIQLIQKANTFGSSTLNLQNQSDPSQVSRPNRDKSVTKESSDGDKDGAFYNYNVKGLNFTRNEGNAGVDKADVGEAIGKGEDYGVSGGGDDHKKCDLYNGRWVRDQTRPLYPPGSCPYIDKDFDCHFHGRPDDDYLRWRWKPNDCDLPSFNATDFLERLRGQRIVYVGDSLNRNMWESMVCMLRNSIRNKKKVYEITGKKEFKKKGFYSFRYEDYNCTVDFVATTFLVKESSMETKNGTMDTLRLDLMDDVTAPMYQDADIIVFNTGHWWTHEKTSKGENYYREGNYVYPKLDADDAFKIALTTWASWIDNNIDTTKTQVFFRSYSHTHFRGGQWNSGGRCHEETKPIFEDYYLQPYPTKMTILEQVVDQMKNTHVMFMNISKLTDYRKDAHPSIYRKHYKTEAEKLYAVKSQDCSHWCLPGVPDAWNELLYASLLRRGKGSWRKQSSL